jgi:putative FmdB family regulatory protein
MPIYEFECNDCGQPFEELVFSASAVDSVVCPSCKSSQVEKMISIFATKVAGGSSYPLNASSAPACNTGST